MNDKLSLRRAVLNITAKCTLKCKHCVMGAPYYKNPPHYKYEIIEKTIEKMFAIVDHIQWIEFSGGEPLMHEELGKMMEKLMEYHSQFDKLLIMTNGTLLPRGDVAEIMKKYHESIIVMMSHYGELSRNADKLIAFCNENNIACEVKKYYGEEQHYGGWVDYGDFHKYNRNEEILKEMYQRCGATKMKGCFTTHGGQMHWCVPSARGMKLTNKIPDNKEEYIDLFDESMTVEMQREKIKKMQNAEYISACDYCAGFSEENSIRIKAAEQV